MRYMIVAGLTLFSVAAQAGDGPWSAAPVPALGDPAVLPAARVSPGMGPTTADTPFSGVPLGSLAADGATSSNLTNGVQTPTLTGE